MGSNKMKMKYSTQKPEQKNFDSEKAEGAQP